jgi:transcription initiation factor TFIIA small subunit
MQFELYRSSVLGDTLADTLDELVKHQQLTGSMAMRVLNQFDKSINIYLEQQIRSRGSLKGHLRNYRLCDEVWTFEVSGATLKVDDELLNIPSLKIVACNGKRPQ